MLNASIRAAGVGAAEANASDGVELRWLRTYHKRELGSYCFVDYFLCAAGAPWPPYPEG